MKYLLDVNTLIALGALEHTLHQRVAHWVRSQQSSAFLTCSITELGFVRILSQAAAYGYSVADAQSLLQKLNLAPGYSFTLIPDELGASHLPKWARSSAQTTDGHLAQLARAYGAELATLDARIPGAFVIP